MEQALDMAKEISNMQPHLLTSTAIALNTLPPKHCKGWLWRLQLCQAEVSVVAAFRRATLSWTSLPFLT